MRVVVMKDYFNMEPLLGYFFRKKDPLNKDTGMLKAMHVVNKVSILIFLFCLIVIVYRIFVR